MNLPSPGPDGHADGIVPIGRPLDFSNITLKLRDTGDADPPPAIRLRRLLKFALRSCKFRAIDVIDASTSKDHH